MECTYLILLDYCVGEVIKVKLTESEKQQLDQTEDHEDFLYSIEDKYDFKVSQVSWMLCDDLCERIYGMDVYPTYEA
jgi:hypothetical protein